MIEFVNFPPQNPGDIRLSAEAKRALKAHIAQGESEIANCSQLDPTRNLEIELSNSLWHMGQAVGHVILTAMESPDRDAAIELITPLGDDYRENVVGHPQAHNAFPGGILKGVDIAINCTQLETGVTT